MGAPLPGAPPCILQRRFPRTAGDWHGFPLLVRALQRGAWFIRNSSHCITSSLGASTASTCRCDGTDDRLPARMDVYVLDRDFLLPLATIPLERLDLHREGPQ
jgi:hypothetical protein